MMIVSMPTNIEYTLVLFETQLPVCSDSESEQNRNDLSSNHRQDRYDGFVRSKIDTVDKIIHLNERASIDRK